MTDIANLGIKVDTTDVKNAQKELGELGRAGEKTEKSIHGLGNTSKGANKSIHDLGSASSKAAGDIKSVDSASAGAAVSVKKTASAITTFSSAIAALGLVSLARDVARMADEYTKFTAQLKLATKSIDEYNEAFSNVKRIANSAQADIASVTTLYARLSQALRDAGKSQREISDISETVALGLKVGGASAAEASSAMLQLSQAFASGVLRGEEFNSVSESAPNLLRALSASMGVTYGELRTLASEGKITSEVLAKAFSDPLLLSNMRQQAKEIHTISGGFTNLRNSITLFVGTVDKLFGSSSLLGSFMDAIANKINVIANRISILGIAFDKLKSAIGLGSTPEAPSSSGKITGLPATPKVEPDFNLLYLNTQYQDLLENLQKGKISLKDFQKQVRDLYVDTGFLADETKKTNKALKESDFDKLSKDLQREVAERKAQLGLYRELTEGEKTLSRVQADRASGEIKLKDAEMQKIEGYIKEIDSLDKLIDQNNKLAAARQKIAEITGQSRVDEMDRIERLKMESDLVGRTAAQQAIIRAEYESQQRLRRTVAAIADAGAGVRDPEEEARHIAQLKAESEARIQIIKEEAEAKKKIQLDAARAQLDAVALKLQQFKPSQELIDTAGLKVAAQRAFDVVEAARSAHRGRMAEIDELAKHQYQVLHDYEREFADAQSALSDKKAQVALAETERIKEINRLRATGEAHNIELADHYARNLENRDVMEALGYSIAKRHYDVAASELELARKNVDAKDIQALRMEEIEKFQRRINDLQAEAFDQVDMQRFGEREIEKQKADQLKLAAEQYVQLEKQIKAGGDIVAIEQEQLELARRIKQYQEETSAGNTASLKAEEESRKRLQEEIAILQEKAQIQRWTDRINTFEQDLRTSWLRLLDHNTRTWDAFVKGLLNVFKKSLFDEIYRLLLKPFTFKILASIVGLTGSSAANSAVNAGLDAAISEAGLSQGFKTMDWLAVGKSIYSGLSGGFTSLGTTITNGFTNLGWRLLDAGYMEAGDALLGAAGQLGVAASYIGAAAAGISVGTLLAGDKSVLGMDGLTTSSIGSIVGAIFGGPIGALAGGIIGGAVNALFGMGEKRYGPTNVVGSFSGSGFTGNLQSEWTQKGGLFRSNKSGVDSQDLSQKAQDTLNGITLGVATAFGKLLSVTGEAARSLDGWAFAIKRQLDTEEAMKTLIHDLGNSMGEFLIPEIKDFKKEGESLADTAIRLTDTFIVTQAIYDMLGHSAYQTGLASLKMRDDLVQLFGGLQQTSSAMSGFYSNFFTADEQRANSWRQLDNTFKALNLTTPQTREEFRALAEAQDLTTEEGRLMFVALMQLAPAFAAVTDPIEDVTKALEDLAAAADQAMNSIASSLDQMRGTKVASEYQARRALDAAMAKVMAAMPWITSWDQLATIQINDASNYSDANKILISEALAAGAALGQLVKTAEDATKALRDKRISDAFEALRRAVDAEKDRLTKIYNDQARVLNDNISKLRGLSDALGNALDSINPMSRRAAQAQLTSALLLAKTGGIFPTADELSGALRAVSEPSEKLFSNFVDFKRDQAYTTITIESLKKLTDNQLSTEELTLKQLEETHNAEMERLDNIISTAQAQIDALNGINNSVLSVAQALANFAAAMGITTPTSGTGAGSGGTGGSSGTPGRSGILPNGQFDTSLNGPITRGRYQGLPIGYTEADAGGINWVEGYGNAVDPYAEVQRRMDLRKALGIPGFASGGYHEGGWRMVGETGRELEYTPPSRIFSNSQTNDILNNAEVVAELRELKAIVKAGHIAIERNTSESARHLRRIENEGVTINNESSNPVQTEVVA